ncbi:hypothetical protein [Bacillus sp. IBL03825]|uniref:hypothetical protein n=1 Tax=Bacillus sp. IBL03825 TaxID=2953580 RepID=UPI002156FDC7|nr:hypothetical protein [Bacillus sp. IBL03825]MCR6850478.1 hypothetical protein [Bacillus sp. IBL03825]
MSQSVKFKTIPQTIDATPKTKTVSLEEKIKITNDNLSGFLNIKSGDDVKLKKFSYSWLANVVGDSSIEITLIDKYANVKKYDVPVKSEMGKYNFFKRKYKPFSGSLYTS